MLLSRAEGLIRVDSMFSNAEDRDSSPLGPPVAAAITLIRCCDQITSAEVIFASEEQSGPAYAAAYLRLLSNATGGALDTLDD